MDWITVIGFGAAILTTIAFLPQVIKTWKEKETKDISLVMYVIFVLGVALWLTYGILLKNPPMIFANIITIILASTVLILKLKYK